jgi:hypothetical protein
VADRQPQGDVPAVAVAEQVRLLDPELPERGGGVVGHPGEGQRAVGVGGAAVALLLERDHLAALRERGEESPE